MYYVGWVGCPHCDCRSRVCIAVDGPVPEGRRIYARCPNDDSQHQFSLARMQLVAECPPGLLPEKLEAFAQAGRPTATRPPPCRTASWVRVASFIVGLVMTGWACIVTYFRFIVGRIPIAPSAQPLASWARVIEWEVKGPVGLMLLAVLALVSVLGLLVMAWAIVERPHR